MSSSPVLPSTSSAIDIQYMYIHLPLDMTPEMEKSFQFNDLPTELRRQIWQYCMPNRICELDIPQPDMVWHSSPQTPCELHQTSLQNARPPVLTRVCHEARQIALETGGIMTCDEDRPRDAEWTSGIDIGIKWVDKNDSEHLNWTLLYEADYGGSGYPIRAMTWMQSERAHCHASIMADFLRSYDGYELERQAFTSFQWLVVMEIRCIHQDIRSTGLFGHLGDAPVQILDLKEADRIANFDSYVVDESPLAETIQRIESAFNTLKSGIKADDTSSIIACISPAIMFRLCLLDCSPFENKFFQARMSLTPEYINSLVN